MKTLTQILQEQYPYGIKLKKIEPRDLIKQLEKLSGNQDIISWTSSHASDIVHIDKFKMAKDGKVTVGVVKMDSSKPAHVIQTYRSTDDAKDTLETYTNKPVFVGEGKLGIWYFVIVNDTADVKRIIQKINPRDVLLKNYKGNSYYKLDGLSYATADSADQDKETATSAKKKYENQLAWNKEIPQADYKFEDEKVIPAAILNKIRQLVGLTSKISVFDEPLKARLEAWQRAHHLKVTGEWDHTTREQFIKLLQDKDLDRATADEYIAKLVVKTDIKPADTTPADGTRVGSGITPAGNILTTQAQINQFRNWFRAGDHVDSEWYDWNTTYAEDKGKKDGLFLDSTGKIDSPAMIAAWEIAGETFMRRLADGDITLILKTGDRVKNTGDIDPDDDAWLLGQ
jgi:hypothetical protein